MEALGGVEPPTNGLGNTGLHLHLSWLSYLRVGFPHRDLGEITSIGSYLATHLATDRREGRKTLAGQAFRARKGSPYESEGRVFESPWRTSATQRFKGRSSSTPDGRPGACR